MLKPGDRIGDRYEVQSLLAKGGMGHIYLVRDMKLNGKVWVAKEITHEENRERFVEEAQMLIQLSHPNIPKITDYFEPDAEGNCYLVMEYIQGNTLQEHFEHASRSMTMETALKYLYELCEILDYLHHLPKPIVFRDLKPANVMVDEHDHIRLIDFGIARAYDQSKFTDTVQMGTIAFAAPEQFDNKQTDPRTDIYSLGTMLYYLITGGKYYFQTSSPLQSALSEYPDEIVIFLHRLLQPRPEDRYQDIREVKAELRILQSKLGQWAAVEQPRPISADSQSFEPEAPEFEKTSRIFTPVVRASSDTESYTAKASQSHPALIIYLLDVSGSMSLKNGEKSRLELVMDSLYVALKQMVFRSTKGSRIASRYRVSIIAYSDEVYDLLGGIKDIDILMQTGKLPALQTYRFTDTAKAFQYAEELLKRELPHIQDCPAPLICHMTDGAYTGDDPEPIVKRIKEMAVKDGNVLVENIFVSDELLEHGIDQPRRWLGVEDATAFIDQYGNKLRAMSSIIPESYRQMIIEANYSLARGSYMMFPGTHPDLVSLGFQMSAATPIH